MVEGHNKGIGKAQRRYRHFWTYMQNEIMSFSLSGVCDIKLVKKADTAVWTLIEIRHDDAVSSTSTFSNLSIAQTVFCKLVADELECY